MKIEYLNCEASEKPKVLKVKLDGKIVGHISRINGYYQYFANGSKSGGDMFHSIQSVKDSIEQE